MAVIRKRKPKIVNGYTMFFPVIPIEYMCQANKCEGLQTYRWNDTHRNNVKNFFSLKTGDLKFSF